jgi:hypothetical protein
LPLDIPEKAYVKKAGVSSWSGRRRRSFENDRTVPFRSPESDSILNEYGRVNDE